MGHATERSHAVHIIPNSSYGFKISVPALCSSFMNPPFVNFPVSPSSLNAGICPKQPIRNNVKLTGLAHDKRRKRNQQHVYHSENYIQVENGIFLSLIHNK